MVSPFKPLLVSLAVLLFGGLALPAATAAPAADSISWKVAAAPGPYGSGRSQFGYTLNPGGTLTDAVAVTNTGTEPITLDLYAADGFTNRAGRFDVLTEDKPSRDVGTWVKPAVRRVTVAAGREARVPFSVTVPANARPGDHVGGIVTALDQAHQRASLAVRVRVSGAVSPRLTIEDVQVHLAGTSNPFGTGSATISYTVRNTGDSVLGGLQKATVAGAFGRASRTVEGARLPELLPGERWRARVRVDHVDALLWTSGRLTVTPVLRDAAGSTSTLPPIRGSDRSLVSAWSVVVLGVLLLALVLVAWLLVRLVRRPRGRASGGVEVLLDQAGDDADGGVVVAGDLDRVAALGTERHQHQ